MNPQQRSRKRSQDYRRPQLIKHDNLKQLTAEWQCSADMDTHSHQNGQGHSSHGNGNGYGHCKVR